MSYFIILLCRKHPASFTVDVIWVGQQRVQAALVPSVRTGLLLHQHLSAGCSNSADILYSLDSGKQSGPTCPVLNFLFLVPDTLRHFPHSYDFPASPVTSPTHTQEVSLHPKQSNFSLLQHLRWRFQGSVFSPCKKNSSSAASETQLHPDVCSIFLFVSSNTSHFYCMSHMDSLCVCCGCGTVEAVGVSLTRGE